MERQEALAMVKKNVKNKNLRKHMYAVEAICKKLANEFGQDEDKWALAGLLHDIDYDKTDKDPEKHSMIGADMLEEAGLPADIVYAVRVHNDAHGLERKSLLDKVLYAADPLSGLIVAAALIKPERKLEAINPEFIMRRFDENSFARGANREQIKSCEEFDMSLDKFVELSYQAMLEISDDLGL
ncbi:MAG: HD domain-containing protein [Clostridia bacterium]